MRRFLRSTWHALRRRLNAAVGAEHGAANILVIIGMSFGLLLVTPFFMNAASEYMTRRSAQNGADAAALAGSEWYAERLTFSPGLPSHDDYYRLPDQFCWLDIAPNLEQHSIDMYKLLEYYWVEQSLNFAPQIAYPEAERLAEENYTTLLPDKYLPDFCQGDCEQNGAFRTLAVSLIARRTIVTAVPSYFGDNGLPVRAHATAVTYLDHMQVIHPYEICWGHAPPFVVIDGEVHYFVRYPLDVVWKIHLKQYQGDPYPGN